MAYESFWSPTDFFSCISRLVVPLDLNEKIQDQDEMYPSEKQIVLICADLRFRLFENETILI